MVNLIENKVRIQFYRRFDGSSLSHIGQKIRDNLEGYDLSINDLGIGATIDKAILDHRSDIGIMYGMLQDVVYLVNHKIRIAGLVCEQDLTESETYRLNQVKLEEIWVPSLFCAEKFQKAGLGDKIVLVPHGVDPVPIIEREYDSPKILMIFNSYITPDFTVQRKGIFETLEAIQSIKDSQLLLRTTHRRYYDKYNLHRVSFLEDRVDDIGDVYSQCNCVLCPSSAEGFGLIGLEALARGIPLISSKTGNDYLTDDISYIPIDLPITKDKIKKAIQTLYDDYPNYKKKAIEQVPKILKEWSWTKARDMVKRRLDRIIVNLFGN